MRKANRAVPDKAPKPATRQKVTSGRDHDSPKPEAGGSMDAEARDNERLDWALGEFRRRMERTGLFKKLRRKHPGPSDEAKGSSRTSRPHAGASAIVQMTSTEAKNGFGRVLETVLRDGTVMITRHDSPQAVVISYNRYQALTQDATPELDQLEAEYDALLAKMATPEAANGALKALRASPEELGRHAVEAARKRKESR